MDAERRIAELERHIDAMKLMLGRQENRLSALESARGQAGEGDNPPWKASYFSMRVERDAARADLAAVKRALEAAGKLGPVVHPADLVMELAAERDAAVREAETWRIRCASAVSMLPEDTRCGELREAAGNLAKLRAAAERLKEKVAQIDAAKDQRAHYHETMGLTDAVREIVALVGEEAKT